MATITQAQLDSVEELSSRKAAEKLGVAKSTINKYRSLAEANGGLLPSDTRQQFVSGSGNSIETKYDGSLVVETLGEVPQTKGEIVAAMIARGFDPEDYEFTYRFSEWTQGAGKGYSARASASPKRTGATSAALNTDELLEVVRSWDFTPVIREKFASADAVLGFADPQIGKSDANGGTEETLNQVLQSFSNFVEVIKEEKPTDVLFADAGDGLENFNNTPQQRETNDLELTEQVRVLRRVQAEGLRMIAPHCERIRHRSVPSNHGMVRIGPQAMASTASNDWGLEVSCQLQDVFEESKFTNIEFGRTEGKHSISLAVELANGTRFGMSHGDQSSQKEMGTWWMKQAFGWNNPLRDVHHLLYGHHHNQMLEEIFEGRWAIGLGSSDRGSAWYTNKTGRSATSGMTMLMTAQGKFWGVDLI